MSVQMQRVQLTAAVDKVQPVPPACLYLEYRSVRIRFSIHGPARQTVRTGRNWCKDHRNFFIGIWRLRGLCEIEVIPWLSATFYPYRLARSPSIFDHATQSLLTLLGVCL